MKEFKGRVLAGGNYEGGCIVSHTGFNTLASCQSSLIKKAKKIIVSDQNNNDLYGKNITGIALVLPQTIGSTTGGMILQVACANKVNPSCMLFSETIDSLAAAGVVLSKVWEDSKMIVIDELGKEFLDTVKSTDTLIVKEDGTVIIK